MGYKLKFDKTKCVGCYACHSACLDAHYGAEEEAVKSFRTIQKVREDEFEKNICPGCIHCGQCMQVCPAGAIYKDEKTGYILGDKDKCTGCGACAKVCPIQVIRYDRKGRIEKCDGCIGRLSEGRKPACVGVCLMGAITWEE